LNRVASRVPSFHCELHTRGGHIDCVICVAYLFLIVIHSSFSVGFNTVIYSLHSPSKRRTINTAIMSNYDWSKPLFITGTTTSGILAGTFRIYCSLEPSMPSPRLDDISRERRGCQENASHHPPSPLTPTQHQDQPLTAPSLIQAV